LVGKSPDPDPGHHHYSIAPYAGDVRPGTGRKRAILQRKLADSQKLYRTAANSVDLVVWEYDPPTRQITMSFDSDFTRHVCEVRGFSAGA
jgi:hypothetical protein